MKLHRKLSPCFPSANQVINANVEVNIVRYGDQGGNLVIAGGNNGIIRVYQRYNDDRPMDLVLQREFNSGTQGAAVMDLDVSPCLDEMVTVCDNPDGKYARIWSISRGVKITELALTSIRCEGAYRFKQCRFAAAGGWLAGGGGGRRAPFFLYATHQPVVVNDKNKFAFMSVWGPLDPVVGTDYQLIDVVDLGTNFAAFGTRPTKMRPTALCTSSCGFFVGVGSGEGAVTVYRLNDQTHKFSRIYNLPKAHSFFVTDIAFLPRNRALKTGHQFELLSIGVDNMLRYHRAPHRPIYLRLERLYKLLSVFLLIFICDRVFLLLSLF
uniref:Prolactin regulatory element binding protein n=1 Tax=Dugesia japonica TaxID=6161 RepID=C0KTK8_DUGJA|nr:prolactin regulatory element binding protein [Dugesia japonica]ACT83083.1 prolactin regulatory element binding protein [Dugesia japonica]